MSTGVWPPVATYWIEVGGVRFEPSHSPNHVVWRKLEGWYGVTDLRGSVDPLIQHDGSFPRSRWFRESAAISLTGWIYGDNRGVLESLRRRVAAELANAHVMRVSDSTGVWEREVDVEKVSIVDRSYPFTAFEVTIDMVAPDPARYSTEEQSLTLTAQSTMSGLVFPAPFEWGFSSRASSFGSITNTGDVPIYPLITFTGVAQSVAVFDASANRRVSVPLVGRGRPVVVDNRHRMITMGGVDVTSAALERGWFEIPPGDTHTFFVVAARVAAPLQAQLTYTIGAY